MTSQVKIRPTSLRTKTFSSTSMEGGEAHTMVIITYTLAKCFEKITKFEASKKHSKGLKPEKLIKINN